MRLKDQTVLITGADGFIGSHLTEMLMKIVSKVKCLSYYNSFNYWGWLEDIPKSDKVEVVTGDIRDPHFCEDLTKDVNVIFHLAALIAIPFSYVAPDSYIDTNIKGTLNLLQAARKNNCTRFIHTSTSEVYGTARYIPINEEHPLQPQSPYSATKVGADALAYSFFSAFNLPVCIARPFNTYGPRQSARAIIPTIISQIASGKKEIEIGDVRPKRDFNYVLDTCAGFIAVAECDKSLGEVINIGSNSTISIGDLFHLIVKLMGKKVTMKVSPQRIRPEKSEVMQLQCDNTKLKEFTGFTPKFSLEEGLKLTIDWFSNPANLAKYKSNLYNI